MVEYLLLNGAEKDSMVDAELQTALHLAAIHRHFLETCLLVKVFGALSFARSPLDRRGVESISKIKLDELRLITPLSIKTQTW